MPGLLQETSGTFAHAPYWTRILINMSQGDQPFILAKRKPILGSVSLTVEAIAQSPLHSLRLETIYQTLLRVQYQNKTFLQRPGTSSCWKQIITSLSASCDRSRGSGYQQLLEFACPIYHREDVLITIRTGTALGS